MLATYGLSPAPIPFGPDAPRIEHTRLRRRLLYSQHETDLEKLLRRQLGNVRGNAYGRCDLTANTYQSLWSQIAVLYNSTPEVLVPAGTEALVESFADVGYWPLMQRVNRDTLALREMLIRFDIDGETGELSARPVFPDMVTARSHPARPQVPVEVCEWVEHPELGWLRYELCVEDEAHPYYRVCDSNGVNVTPSVLGPEYTGDTWPEQYRDASGRPVLPFAMYHAAQTGSLFDPYTLREIVEGSLNIGVLLTFYGHIVRNAAWSQRYVVGASPKGMAPTDTDSVDAARHEIVSDPATLLQFSLDENATGAQIGAFNSPADPEAILRSISMYERRILLLANVSPPDVTRQEADVRSGYSLAVAREAIREQQRLYEPQFRRADQSAFRIAACLSNRVLGTSYSENARDYRIAYRGLPETPAEVKLRLEVIKAEREAGVIGPVSAVQKSYPLLTREEAIVRAAEAQTEALEVEAAAAKIRKALGVVEADEAMEPAKVEATEHPDAEVEAESAPDTAGEGIAAAAVDAGQPASAVALNGAQVQAAQGIITAVAAGQLPRATGVQMLIQFFNIPAEEADKLMGPVGESFRVEAPA